MSFVKIINLHSKFITSSIRCNIFAFCSVGFENTIRKVFSWGRVEKEKIPASTPGFITLSCCVLSQINRVCVYKYRIRIIACTKVKTENGVHKTPIVTSKKLRGFNGLVCCALTCVLQYVLGVFFTQNGINLNPVNDSGKQNSFIDNLMLINITDRNHPASGKPIESTTVLNCGKTVS